MNHRNSNRGRERDERPWRTGEPSPEYDERGLHGEHRREYRGRESYEQQTLGGEGGRSGMFPERSISGDNRERYRNNADEDARGYQNIGWRSEFVSSDRDRPDYGRYSRAGDRDYDEARYGFDARDYRRQQQPQGPQNAPNYDYGDDYSHTDYGARDYHRPSFERGLPGFERDPRSHAREYANNFGGAQRESGPRELGYGRPPLPRPGNRGPRGYKRSDERVREEVCERLGRDWEVDASDLEVNVANGEVTLTGNVDDRQQKFRAEHLADSVWGVNEVHNQLRVKRDARATKESEPSTQAARNTSNQNRSS
jgi:osmotically-inducible protein OsmY